MSFLNTLSDLATQTLGPFGPLIAIGILGVVLILASIALLVSQMRDPVERLNNGKSDRKQTKEKLRLSGANEHLEKYKSFLEPQNAEELSSMRLKLMQAGYQTRDAVRAFHLAQFLLGILGIILGTGYFMLIIGTESATTQQTLMYILGPGAVGYMLPKYLLTRRLESRKEEIEQGFPDSLDMLLVCIEAGQSLDQAILRVSSELQTSFPSLSQEYRIVSNEMKAGKDKPLVLRDMAERWGVQDVASFVTVLIQSTQFGTSIADALRVYSSEMRDKRVMRAEEKANKLPTKMTLATMMLTLPPLLIILVGPSIYNVTQIGQ